MKLLLLNIYEGCPEKDRFQKIINFVNQQKPDILGLLELNGWHLNNFIKLKLFKKKTRFRYHGFCKSKDGYHIALLSRTEFVKTQAINRGMWHGAVRAKIKFGTQDLTIILTHLDPFTETNRLKELKVLTKHILGSQNVILMGDLNSLSPQDGYNEAKLLRKAKEIKLKKFGTRKLHKSVITQILSMGLVDLSKKFSKKFEHTVPSRYNIDEAHFIKLRLDYMFASPELLASCVKKARVIRTNQTNQLSDHFPLLAEVKKI